MKTVEIKQRLAEEILDQLEGAQQDNYVQSTENVINDLKQALRIPVVSQRSEPLPDDWGHGDTPLPNDYVKTSTTKIIKGNGG